MNIVKILIVNTLISIIMSILVAKSTPNNDNKDCLKEGNFNVEYGKGFKIFFILGTFLIWSLFVASAGQCLGLWIAYTDNDIICAVGFGIFALLGVYSILGTCVWRIRVFDYNQIEYRNYFFIKKKYTFEQIEKLKVKKNGDINVFVSGKKVFCVPGNIPIGNACFVRRADKFGIEIME